MGVLRAESFKRWGDGVRVNGRVVITGPAAVEIHDNVHIGDNAMIRGDGGLVIGENTHISRNLVLYTMSHNYRGERLPYDDTLLYKPVRIGRNVWIGHNVCITPGTTIGEGAIIQMGTTVFGEVPPLAIIGPAPWGIIGTRDPARYKELDEAGAYGGVNGEEFVRYGAT